MIVPGTQDEKAPNGVGDPRAWEDMELTLHSDSEHNHRGGPRRGRRRRASPRGGDGATEQGVVYRGDVLSSGPRWVGLVSPIPGVCVVRWGLSDGVVARVVRREVGDNGGVCVEIGERGGIRGALGTS